MNTTELVLRTFTGLPVGYPIALHLRSGTTIRGEVDECDEGIVAVVAYSGKNSEKWERTEVHPAEVCAITIVGPR